MERHVLSTSTIVREEGYTTALMSPTPRKKGKEDKAGWRGWSDHYPEGRG